ncbi:MAG: PAS domain S-box protein [Bacteroidales bacterium]|nr:PAS domain S-box protein [Bacteroidales bacterium]
MAPGNSFNNFKEAIRISLIFFGFSFLWILFSDNLILIITSDIHALSKLQTYKGWFYITSASLIIYFLISSEIKKKNHEIKLRIQSERNFKDFAENARDVIFRYRIPDDTYEYISPSVERLYGYTPQECYETPGMTMKLIHPEHHDFFNNELIRILAEDVSPAYEYKAVHKNGNEIWVNQRSILIRDEDGQPYIIEGFVTDVTKRKHIERELKKSEKRFRELFEKSRDGICFVDSKANFIDSNPAYIEMLGYSLEELKRKNFFDITPEKWREWERTEIVEKQLLARGFSDRYEKEYVKKDGSVLPVELNAYTMQLENSDDVIFWAVARDISERKSTERVVLNAIINTEEKERERFAQEIHDGLGPLFSTIKLYIQSAYEEKNEKERKFLLNRTEDTINEAILSLREISNNISPHILKNFGLSSAIASFVERLQSKVEFEIDFQSNINTRLDETIETVLYRSAAELLNNTVKHAHASKVVIQLAAAAHMLSFTYADNGIGVDMKKELVNKKGLGLFNIKNRIHSIRGDIQFLSNRKNGFKVIVNIPL